MFRLSFNRLVPGQKESVIDAVERMVDLCETDFKNSATWKSLHESHDSSLSTESEKAAGPNIGRTGHKYGNLDIYMAWQSSRTSPSCQFNDSP